MVGSIKSDLLLCLQVYEAKFNRLPGRPLQRAGDPPCKMRPVPRNGENGQR